MNFSVDYALLPKVGEAKVPDANQWRIAQNCSNVKNHIKTPRYRYFDFTKALYDKQLDIPYLWTSVISQGYCAEYAIYPNCRIDCNKFYKKGRQPFLVVLSKEMAEIIVRDRDICRTCVD